jgi:hypothetical protein
MIENHHRLVDRLLLSSHGSNKGSFEEPLILDRGGDVRRVVVSFATTLLRRGITCGFLVFNE